MSTKKLVIVAGAAYVAYLLFLRKGANTAITATGANGGGVAPGLVQAGYDPATAMAKANCAASGGYWNYDTQQCEAMTQLPPKVLCAQAGGYWDGANCVMPSSTGL